MEEIMISKLSEFMDYVEKLPKEFMVSRGQGNKLHSLLPGALRKDASGNFKYTRQSIAYFLNEFKVNSHNYMKRPSDIENNYEWMIYGQHYGIPTRLLDFTTSHIISLMFAVESAFEDKESEDGVVWFLDPIKLNNESCYRSQIITLSDNENISLDNCNGPIVIQGRKLNKRINAQSGLFIYFQDSSDALENIIKREDILKKVIIKQECKRDILVSLYSMGIGMTQIYPELSSVAKDIIMKENIKQYLREE
ncbi:FRG domain-containing protein [Clostridium gasigenes]|uniref:FRG domain-containing protein n=1 Tax=Clostridium gasigenes TaxID=94869 RepID=UPI001A9AADA9|nr:FRG domain-containing protein [Clostridium gasigenes]